MKQKAKNDWIKVIGAREHNLKDIDVAIPKHSLTVITGPSGSGKSSLALDILYTEGKRRYMESLSSYARQFLGIVKKPAVDRIEGLCPAIAIEQKTVGSNPRSTVGTITEIYDYLRVLFARIGKIHCPECACPIASISPDDIKKQLIEQYAHKTITIAAPIALDKKGEFSKELTSFVHKGWTKFRIDGQTYKLRSEDDVKALKLKKTYKHTIDVIIDVIEIVQEEYDRLGESIEKSLEFGSGVCRIISGKYNELISTSASCIKCGHSIPELEPRMFSFNSPLGACKQCQGIGVIHQWPWKAGDKDAWKERYPDFFGPKYAQEKTCKSCLGKRLNRNALAVTIGEKDIIELCDIPIKDLRIFFDELKLRSRDAQIADELVQEIKNRIAFLDDVGLSYLTLNRKARTLSGGEGQRIRLATQIGSALSGVLYVLDEPSIGLHQKDNDRLIATLKKLRDHGNTVIVVEHDTDTMKQSDYVIDMGPAAGVLGGQVTAYGTPQELSKKPQSLTGAYLAGKKEIAIPESVRTPQGWMTLYDASKNNLQNQTVKFPLGVLCGISGVSGSGKSSLVMQELVPAVQQDMGGYARKKKSKESHLNGADALQSLVVIDQTPIGRTPRSNPATYLGVFDDIRRLFTSLPDSNARGYKPGRFSFNVADGRCSECKGDGTVTIEMHFLPAVTMTCKLCKGKRFNAETLTITYKGKHIADVLDMTAYEAATFFKSYPTIYKRLKLLCDVGLEYLKLGQPSSTLSGGEAQRIKLVEELAKRGSNTLYILDEPTTGLHTDDIAKLLAVLNTLVDKGNSMIVIEHNIDVLKTVDYLIDLGPDGGDAGGIVVAQGTPHVVSQNSKSHTGRYLKQVLKGK